MQNPGIRATGRLVLSGLLLAGLLATKTSAGASASTELATLLNDFLAGVSEASVHDRFWADDLVYTSSSGRRLGKADIMAGFQDHEGEAEPAPAYSAEAVRIAVYGTTAVVAFRLVAAQADGSRREYFNTGTFVQRDGQWRAVAWQATVIPD
jgi:ketosteroid isomerase-like protein